MLVNGEDLSEYRRVSQKIFGLLRQEGKGLCPVERLGMDENFMDVTRLVEEEVYVDHPVGHVYGSIQMSGCKVTDLLTCVTTTLKVKNHIQINHLVHSNVAFFSCR